MKYVFLDLPEIKKRTDKSGFVLLLDFDLTLSPLAPSQKDAFLPEITRSILKKIISYAPVVIMTGRKLSDIKKRVGIKGIIYIGNHGLEHNLDKKNKILLTPVYKNALLQTKKEVIRKLKTYRGIKFEDKKYAFALGYRLVKKNKIQSLESTFRKIQKEIEQEGLLEARLNKKTFEVRPKIGIDKGTASRLALKTIKYKLHKKVLPIYVGDAETDEDAFRALAHGITIKVGKSKKSLAKWYLRDQKEVALFLRWLLSLKQ